MLYKKSQKLVLAFIATVFILNNFIFLYFFVWAFNLVLIKHFIAFFKY